MTTDSGLGIAARKAVILAAFPGTRARGEAGPDSDYDLMLVVSASKVPRYRRDQQAFRALCGLGVPKEIIVLTRAEFEAGRKFDLFAPGHGVPGGKAPLCSLRSWPRCGPG